MKFIRKSRTFSADFPKPEEEGLVGALPTGGCAAFNPNPPWNGLSIQVAGLFGLHILNDLPRHLRGREMILE
jgi:hypothetical protein